jgi:hypothetical protein
MVETCGYLLQCLLIGYATVLLLFRSQKVSWPFALGLGITIGCCEAALLFFYAALAGIRPCAETLAIADAAAILTLAALHHAGRRVTPRWPGDLKRNAFGVHLLWYLLPAILVGYAGVTAVRIATSTPLIEWDAWMIWLYKAKIIAAEKLIPPPWVFSSPSGFGHPRYPLLWPMLAAGAFGITGTADDHLARIVPVFLWMGWGLMTYSALRWKLPRLPAVILASLQLSLPAVIQYMTDGDADVMLAVFYGGMICLIIRLGDETRWSVLTSAALLAAAAAFTKNEGIPLACFGAAMVLVMAAPKGLGRAALMSGAFLGLIAILLAPWYVWSRQFKPMDEDYPSRLSALTHGENLARLAAIVPALGREALNFRDGGPLWLLLLIVPAIAWRALHCRHIQALWALLAAHFLLYAFVYVITPFDLNWLLANSLNRLFVHITPVAILLIGYHWAALGTSHRPRTG